MTKTFANFPDLASELAFDLIGRLVGNDRLQAEFGASNQSCSRYVRVNILDAEGDYIDDGEFKVRFSDHADRYGSDVTIRIDSVIETVEDDGEYVCISIEDDHYAEALATAEARIATFIAGIPA